MITVVSAHDDTSEIGDEEDWKMSMAQVIEFDTLARFTPAVKRLCSGQRGKVIPFISPWWQATDELVCAYEEPDSEPSQWPEWDEVACHAELE